VSKRLAADVERLESRCDELEARLREEEDSRRREAAAADSQGERLAGAEIEVARLQEEREDAREQVRQLEQGLVEASAAAEDAGRRASAAQSEAESLSGKAAQEGMLRAQLAHLKRDNARLVRLVASTAEYRQFALSKFGAGAASRAGGKLRSSYLGVVPQDGAPGAEQYLGGGRMRPRGEDEDEDEDDG